MYDDERNRLREQAAEGRHHAKVLRQHCVRLAEALPYDPECPTCTEVQGYVPTEDHPPECARHIADLYLQEDPS